MRSALKRTLAALVVAALVCPASAQNDTQTLCQGRGFTIGFFNGVWNLPQDAADGAKVLGQMVGSSHRASDSGKDEPVKTELFYNTTGAAAGSFFMQDVAEVFAQRSTDINIDLSDRWELFWDVVSGDRGGAWEVLQQVAGVPALTVQVFDAVQAQTLANLVRMGSTAPTDADIRRHRARITALVTERQKIVFVGHSQGSLFLNRAYEAALRTPTPDGSTITEENVKAVHIAPASPTLKGAYTLANIDIVINALRLAPVGVPASNLTLPLSRLDPSGHTLGGTYLDGARAGRSRVSAQLDGALDTVVTPKTKGNVGFFTATLTWTGDGDVDLHALEPGGKHVYFYAMKGDAGELDVDNTVSDGPEHYRASCDPQLMQPGAYRLGIHNFSRTPPGTAVTLQVSSALGGELFTTTVPAGPVTSNNTNEPEPKILVTVSVAPDERGTLQATIKK